MAKDDGGELEQARVLDVPVYQGAVVGGVHYRVAGRGFPDTQRHLTG
jgi:hypothetical protein